MRDRLGRGMSAMSGRKCIIDESVAEARKEQSKRGIVGLFARMETGVLHEEAVAGRCPFGCCKRPAILPVGEYECHPSPKCAFEGGSHRLQRHFWHHLAFRTLEMSKDDDCRSFVE